MKPEDFNRLKDARFAHCSKVLEGKSAEYSSTEDKLFNFKDSAAFLDCSPEEALLGMLAKHLSSMKKLARESGRGKIPSKQMVDEKLGDVLNYVVLLEAIIEERRENNE